MTYSIVGRDSETGELGVAVQSQAFNTGAAVPWAWPGVGAVATQSFTDRRYGWRGLELMAGGASAADALAGLRADDELADFRQVGMMTADGRTSQWTGANCVPSAGGAAGEDWIAQANMVESPRVWEAMGEAFEASTGPLAPRLLAALDAAEAEGGDWRGRGGADRGRPERGRALGTDHRPPRRGGRRLARELRRLLERALGYREANRATAGDSADIARRRGLPELYVQQCRSTTRSRETVRMRQRASWPTRGAGSALARCRRTRREAPGDGGARPLPGGRGSGRTGGAWRDRPLPVHGARRATRPWLPVRGRWHCRSRECRRRSARGRRARSRSRCPCQSSWPGRAPR